MDKSQFYFDRLVLDVDLNKIYTDVELHFRRIIIDTIGIGVITASNIVQNSPTADLSVDAPVITAIMPTGIRVFTTAISNILITGTVGSVTGAQGLTPININGSSGTPISGDGAAIVLPIAANDAYVTILLYSAILQSDPKLDGLGNTVNFSRTDSFQFKLIRGADAPTGTAVKPTDPNDGGRILADILLHNTTTTIVNADIDVTRKQNFVKAIP